MLTTKSDQCLHCSRLSVISILVEYKISRLDGPGHAKMCLMPYANNKGADPSAHARSLISTFVVCCLDSMVGWLC